MLRIIVKAISTIASTKVYSEIMLYAIHVLYSLIIIITYVRLYVSFKDNKEIGCGKLKDSFFVVKLLSHKKKVSSESQIVLISFFPFSSF
jgi:hypothetical protein